MTRGELVTYLIDEGCYEDDLWENEHTQMWRNSNNGETCLIPNDDEISVRACCHIFVELKVAPMLEIDSDYYVYTSFLQVKKEKENQERSQ